MLILYWVLEIQFLRYSRNWALRFCTLMQMCSKPDWIGWICKRMFYDLFCCSFIISSRRVCLYDVLNHSFMVASLALKQQHDFSSKMTLRKVGKIRVCLTPINKTRSESCVYFLQRTFFVHTPIQRFLVRWSVEYGNIISHCEAPLENYLVSVIR